MTTLEEGKAPFDSQITLIVYACQHRHYKIIQTQHVQLGKAF